MDWTKLKWGSRRKPQTEIQGRTGDARYVGGTVERVKGRRKAVQANRLDSVSIEELDRTRWHPTVRDALRTRRGPLERADFYFVSARPDIVEAAQQTLEAPIRELLKIIFKGGMEFGRQSVEIVWEPIFDVTVTTGQGDGQETEKIYPFMWRPWFKSFSPHDTRVLIDPVTGKFAGVRQFVRGLSDLEGKPINRDVLCPKALHYTYEQEFDGNYGNAATRGAVPLVEAWLDLMDSMVQFGDVLSNPYKKVKYPLGSLPDGQGGQIDNGDRALEIGSAFESGSTVCIPSEPHALAGQATTIPKWDVTFEQPASATADYVNQLSYLDAAIRLVVGAPELASGGEAPSNGTYNLGEVQIDLFLSNLQAELDKAEEIINEMLLKWWTIYNYGQAEPPCQIRFKPLNLKATLMLLQALLQNLSTGEPLSDAENNLIFADWGKLLSDNGIPHILKKGDPRAKELVDHVTEKLRQLDGGGVSQADLAEWDESKHPRDRHGKFTRGTSIEDHPDFDPDHVVNGVKPTAYGLVGPVYGTLRGNAEEAVKHLLNAGVGEVPGAIQHPEVGEIDLIYGGPKYGLAHIATKHPEVINRLGEIVQSLPVVPARSLGESFWLEDENYRATVKQNWGASKEAKTWLLTAFEKKNAVGG